jgi:ribosomal protein S18 acetylase RimI-like enzyme
MPVDDQRLQGREALLTVDVRPAGAGDQEAVVGVITLAFSTDPMARWVFPDAATYLAVAPDFAQAFGGRSFALGTAHLVQGGLGAAMWLPPGVHSDSERLGVIAEQHAPRERLDDLMQVFARMDAYHPAEPCWYLPLIGVDPTCQGRGCGSALLRYGLERCDCDAVAAYLESSNPRNVPLYQRHGFEIIGNIQAGTSPTLVPMLRRPR